MAETTCTETECLSCHKHPAHVGMSLGICSNSMEAADKAQDLRVPPPAGAASGD